MGLATFIATVHIPAHSWWLHQQDSQIKTWIPKIDLNVTELAQNQVDAIPGGGWRRTFVHLDERWPFADILQDFAELSGLGNFPACLGS